LDFLLNERTPALLDLFNTPRWARQHTTTWPQNQVLRRKGKKKIPN